MMRRVFRRAVLIALALALLTSSALAADFSLSRRGSLTVVIRTAEGISVPNARVLLYRVADATVTDSNVRYILTEEFAQSGADVSDLAQAGLADTLAAWLSGRDIAPMATGVTGRSGQAIFTGMPVGLYLVAQQGFDSTETVYFTEIRPFLAQMPMPDDSTRGWTYQITAQPKVNPIPTPTPVPTQKPTTPPGNLPQTGSIAWPIPLMCVGGLMLFAVGWALVFVKKRKDGHA